MSAQEDIERATRHARTHAKEPGVPPHWLRCNHVDDEDRRCRLAEGHDGAHRVEAKP